MYGSTTSGKIAWSKVVWCLIYFGWNWMRSFIQTDFFLKSYIKKYTDFSLETQTKKEKERSFFGSKIYFFSLSTPISYFSVYILKVKLMPVYKPNVMSLHHSPYTPQINKNKNKLPYKSFVSIYCTCFIYRTPYPIYLFIYRRF